MAKFRVNVEFKLNIEGDRDDIPLIAANLRQQLGSTLDPAAQIASGEMPRKVVESKPVEDSKEKTRRPRRASGSSPKNGDDVAPIHTWLHDAARWGFPKQDWTMVDKSIWLLHVAATTVNVSEMSPSEITKTFNKLFKSSGQLRPSNVSRDLGKARADNPALVSLDVNTNKFFLTDAGKIAGEKLCNVAKGQPARQGETSSAA